MIAFKLKTQARKKKLPYHALNAWKVCSIFLTEGSNCSTFKIVGVEILSAFNGKLGLLMKTSLKANKVSLLFGDRHNGGQQPSILLK